MLHQIMISTIRKGPIVPGTSTKSFASPRVCYHNVDEVSLTDKVGIPHDDLQVDYIEVKQVNTGVPVMLETIANETYHDGSCFPHDGNDSLHKDASRACRKRAFPP